jgi:hypothetical protein
MPNLKALAEDLPAAAYRFLERPPRYAIQTVPRERPERVKPQIVRERGYKTSGRSPLLRKLGQGCSIARHESQGTEVLPELSAVTGAVGCPRGAAEGA